MPSTATAQTLRPPASRVMTTWQTTTGRVIGEVEITDGNIANNHIYLRAFVDRCPAEAIGGSNKATRAKRDLTIEWGGTDPVQTDLDGQKEFFRARGWIGAFYRLYCVRAGDRVVVEEIAAYRYRVSLMRCGSQGRGAGGRGRIFPFYLRSPGGIFSPAPTTSPRQGSAP